MKEHNIPKLRHLYWCADQLLSEALSRMDLTASQGCAMGFISHQTHPPVTRDLEQALHLSHASAVGLLDRLEKKGFLTFEPDPKDLRCKRIYITPKGEACNTHMHDAMDAIEQQLLRGFTEEEQEVFKTLIERAICNMGGAHQHCHKEEFVK